MKFSEVTTRARILYGCAGLLLFSTVFLVVTVGYLFSVYNTQKRLEVLYTAKIEANVRAHGRRKPFHVAPCSAFWSH